MTGRATAVQLPAPLHHDEHATVWPGGIRLAGPLLSIPGRTLHGGDPEQLAEVRTHAASVLAALDALEGRPHG